METLPVDDLCLFSLLPSDLITVITTSISRIEKLINSPVTSEEATRVLRLEKKVGLVSFCRVEGGLTSYFHVDTSIKDDQGQKHAVTGGSEIVRYSFRTTKISWIDSVIGLYPKAPRSDSERIPVVIGELTMMSDILIFDPRTMLRVFLWRFEMIDEDTASAKAKTKTKEYFTEVSASNIMPLEDRKKYIERTKKYTKGLVL